MEKEAGSGEQERQEEEKSSSSPPSTVKKKKKKMKKVLVAIDESESSVYALKWALNNLFPCVSSSSCSHEETADQGQPTLVLLHVQQPYQSYIFPAPGPAVYATSAVVESVKKAQEQNSAALLARALELCKGSPIKIESIVMNGDPKEMICEATAQIDADLLAVGSRGYGRIKRAFLGSVSDYCAHHAKCPVLIVRPSPK